MTKFERNKLCGSGYFEAFCNKQVDAAWVSFSCRPNFSLNFDLALHLQSPVKHSLLFEAV